MPYIFTANRSLLATSLLHEEGLSCFLCNKGLLKLMWSWDTARRCGDKYFETGARSPKTGSGLSAVTGEVTLGQASLQTGTVECEEEEPWVRVWAADRQPAGTPAQQMVSLACRCRS